MQHSSRGQSQRQAATCQRQQCAQHQRASKLRSLALRRLQDAKRHASQRKLIESKKTVRGGEEGRRRRFEENQAGFPYQSAAIAYTFGSLAYKCPARNGSASAGARPWNPPSACTDAGVLSTLLETVVNKIEVRAKGRKKNGRADGDGREGHRRHCVRSLHLRRRRQILFSSSFFTFLRALSSALCESGDVSTLSALLITLFEALTSLSIFDGSLTSPFPSAFQFLFELKHCCDLLSSRSCLAQHP